MPDRWYAACCFETVRTVRVDQTLCPSLFNVLLARCQCCMFPEEKVGASVFYGVVSPTVVLSWSVIVRGRPMPLRLLINES